MSVLARLLAPAHRPKAQASSHVPTLKAGSRGHAVRVLQEKLTLRGYPTGGVDGVFGAKTARAVRYFQRAHHLHRDGVVGAHTWAALHGPQRDRGFGPVLRRGAERPRSVKALQQRLAHLDFHPGRADGLFGPKTEAAVKAFQRKHELPASGIVGPKTWSALHVRIRLKSKIPDAHPGGGPLSARGRAQMSTLMRIAMANASGKRPQGRCLGAVQDYLARTRYGKFIGAGVRRLPVARDFATVLNAGHHYKALGLRRLNIHNPYNAPPGSIIVVRSGTPGTHHPFAGDIVVKGPGNRFFNDGEMGYGGPGNFPPGNNFVLGVYAPR
jgi:peptidoglycan hydrolase-like protein with peptidoglycan-binding domain